MRLIDADRLLEDMGASCLPIMEKGISEITGDDSTIMDHINQAPTIKAVPLDRLGDFGKLFMDYTGCPRGAMGRACMPIEEEVLQMKPITDVDGGRWIPVNVDALMHLVTEYVRLRDSVQPVVHAYWYGAEFDGYADGCPVYDTWGCSNCHEEQRSEGDPPSFGYCPICGALMDGDPHDSGQ